MGTTRNPLAGRYFNDPNIAVGLSNLAAAFAPPSPEEYLLAERVKGERLTNQAMNDLYAAADGNMDVLGGIVAGGWTPNQGFEAMRGALSNERRGQDITAQTAITNNRTDNMFDLAQNYQQPLTFGEAVPALPPEFAAALDIPVLPATSGMASGAPKPAPTLAEAQGALFNQGAEMLTDDQIAAYAFGDTPVQNIVTPDGPRVSTTLGAIGQEPFINPGGQAGRDLRNYVTPDGREGSAVFNPTDGSLTDANTGEKLPPGTTTYTLQGGDRKAATSTPASAENEYRRTQAAATEIDLIANDIEALLDSQPGAAGLVGQFQRVGQNIAQVSREIADAVEKNGADAPVDLRSIEASLSQGPYNPVFQQIQTFILRLAYANAQVANPGGEVGQIALARELEALGQGLLGNDESIRAALSVSRQTARIKMAAAEALRGNAPGAVTPLANQNAGAPAVSAEELGADELQWLQGGN